MLCLKGKIHRDFGYIKILKYKLQNYNKQSLKDKIQGFTCVPSRYVFSCVIRFRFIHFILISTVHALFLTCLPVSIYGS